MKNFPYGAVLKIQREYSFNDIFARLKKIKDLGLNHVVIWPAVYWWEDRGLPNYPYHTGHEILRYAEEIGLQIIMELAGQITSLEYLPDFLMKEEYYAVTFDGRLSRDKTSYGYINYFHPEVKQLIEKQFTEIAENYKGYSALYGYDIWNETMFASFDQYTLHQFRVWLKHKYKTIDRLNEVWDRAYHDWSQIHFTRWMWASVMPQVDYHQFHKETIGIILREWGGYVKAVDPTRPVIADNVHSMIIQDGEYERPQDDWNVAENVDELGLSFYPKNTPKVLSDFKRWEMLTGFHSAAKNGCFWVAELQTHLQTIFNPFSVVYPYELKWWNWESISHGAKGLIYWMWEPFIKGVQTLGRGLVDYRGEYTQRAGEAQRISEILQENATEFLTYLPEKPKAVILFDKVNHDFTKAYTEHYKPFISTSLYLDSIAGLYQSLWEQNIPTKFITPKEILNGSVKQYHVLFMTNQLNISDELAQTLKEFVSQGGVIICDGKFGEIDDFGVLQHQLPGGELNDILGYRHVDVSPDQLTIQLNWEGNEPLMVEGYYEKRYVEIANDAPVTILGRFSDGEPAVLQSKYGQGQIIYLATLLWYGYNQQQHPSVAKFVQLLAREFALPLHCVSNNELKICTLRGDDGLLLFVFNYSEKHIQAEVELKEIPTSAARIVSLYSDTRQYGAVTDQTLKIPVSVNARDVEVFKITLEI